MNDMERILKAELESERRRNERLHDELMQVESEARAEIERQKCELSMADHHMYNQRKLIEKLAGAINDAVSNGGMNDYNDRILKEALRAAEGGEEMKSEAEIRVIKSTNHRARMVVGFIKPEGSNSND